MNFICLAGLFEDSGFTVASNLSSLLAKKPKEREKLVFYLYQFFVNQTLRGSQKVYSYLEILYFQFNANENYML